MGMFGSGFGNVLQTIGATLKDASPDSPGGNLQAIQQMRMLQQKEAQKQAFTQQLAGLIGGQAQAAGGSAPSGGGLNINDPRMPMIALQAQQAGVPIETLLDVMKAQQPKVSFAPDNTAINEKDGSIVGKSFPKLDNGMVNNRDADGNPVISNANGYVHAASEAAGGVTGAQEQAKAPYTDRTFTGPDGAPITVSGETVRALGAKGGIISRGQTPAEKILAESAARGDADRANAIQDRAMGAGRQLTALDNMERLLPDVISGFGSDIALQSARAMAKMGSKDAQRKVAATETFLNQGRVLVADMIKAFGANPTEGERKYAERMSGADAQLNPETLKEGIRLQRERINRDLAAAGKSGNRSGGASAMPAPPAAQRAPRTVYMTPKGPMMWTGTGWLPQ